jgi:hypothetical protein
VDDDDDVRERLNSTLTLLYDCCNNDDESIKMQARDKLIPIAIFISIRVECHKRGAFFILLTLSFCSLEEFRTHKNQGFYFRFSLTLARLFIIQLFLCVFNAFSYERAFISGGP